MKSFLNLFIASIVVLVSYSTFAQDHGHLNVGAAGTSQNDKLIFENGAVFSTDSGYIKTLTYTNSGKYAGYYQQNITLTALPATAPYGGPAANACALGSQIYAQIVSVDGPPGGAFNFWDAGATSPTITLPSGTTGTNIFKLSESDGSAGLDPYGHIHGRRFTATKPGIYTVGFRALDLCTNGAGGGPIHTPSAVLKVHFQAGVTIASVARRGSTNVVTFGSMLNATFYLESTDDLTTTNWTQVDSLAGDDALRTLNDINPPAQPRFYRIRVTTP